MPVRLRRRKVVRPESWESLVAELYEGDWRPDIRRHRSMDAFRGVVDANWKMDTSLKRMGGPYSDLEHHLIRNFRKYAHRDVVDRDTFWYWLSVAQHHGLPTRLLDWTYSPFVAMHFATDHLDKMDVDGVIWVARVPSIHQHLPATLTKILRREGSGVFTVDMLASLERQEVRRDPTSMEVADRSRRRMVRNLQDFDKLTTNPFALFFEPPSIDDRIVNQFALFSVVSSPTLSLDDWLQTRPSTYKKVLVPAELKWEIRDKLDQANITERVVYPGLDGLSRWLRRHYSTRPTAASDEK